MASPQSTSSYYIGILSGTSADSIDAALVEIKKDRIRLIETASLPIDDALKADIHALCHPGDNAIYRMGTLDTRLGHLFSDCIESLMKKANLTAKDIAGIGSHGQNIRHMPYEEFPFTLQIADPNIISARTGITTVGDFRRRDIALGGQGAPLTPAFHHFLFQKFAGAQWVVNIGGIANVTRIDPKLDIIGFDTGPGNTLLDAWYYQHTGKRFDACGEYARSGKIKPALLDVLLADPYFSKAPPKSTGLEYFNLKWLAQSLKQCNEQHIHSEDMQATLTELTAISIANTLNDHPAEHCWICGGGSKNTFLMERLQAHCQTAILSTDAMGIPVDWIEACAFAWFAYQTLHRRPSNIPSVTGASAESVLGAIYCH